MTPDAHELSRQFIAGQTSHRAGSAFEVRDRPSRVTPLSIFLNLSALGFWVALALVAWVGMSGR
jgi:hypothetical protein